MDFKDHLAILREQYKQECDDNNELYRRGNFLFLTIGALGTLSFKLASTIKSSSDIGTDVRIWLAGAVIGLLAIAGVCLAGALWMRHWHYPKLAETEKVPPSSPVPQTSDAELMRAFAEAVTANRHKNAVRFHRLNAALMFSGAAAAMIVAQALSHGWYSRHKVESNATPVKTSVNESRP